MPNMAGSGKAARRPGGARRAAAGAAGPETIRFADVLSAAACDGAARKSERTRARLLAAMAREIMSGAARADLKVATVTAAAGVAHGTFYRYFADLDAALNALIEEFARFIHARLADAREGEPGSRERVRSATLAYTSLFRENAPLMRWLVGIDSAFASSYRALNRAWYARMAAAIARRRQGPNASPEAFLPTAYALGGMIDEFLTQLYLRKDPALRPLASREEKVAELLTDLWSLGAYGTLPR